MIRSGRIAAALILLGQLPVLSGCGVVKTIFGTRDPLEKKSENYEIIDMAKLYPNSWSRINDPGHGDRAFESKKTDATLAISSTCRRTERTRAPSAEAQSVRLKQLSNEVTRGLINLKLKREQAGTLSGKPALKTTVVGDMVIDPNQPNQATGPVVLQSIVLQDAKCSYALIGASKPEHFDDLQRDFSKFAESFKLRN